MSEREGTPLTSVNARVMCEFHSASEFVRNNRLTGKYSMTKPGDFYRCGNVNIISLISGNSLISCWVKNHTLIHQNDST